MRHRGEAIAEGLELIRRGDADVVIAGSSEAPITPLSMAGFCAIRAVSRRNDEPARASRPFDEGRDGFVMSEGAGAVILESPEHAERRGAEPIAAVAGYGRTTDAYHVTAPDEEGRGVERAMRLALEDAGLTAEDVGHVNAHATATPTGDGPGDEGDLEGHAPRAGLRHQVHDGPLLRRRRRHGRHHVRPRPQAQGGPPTINLENLADDCEELNYVGSEPGGPEPQGRHLQLHGIRRA